MPYVSLTKLAAVHSVYYTQKSLLVEDFDTHSCVRPLLYSLLLRITDVWSQTIKPEQFFFAMVFSAFVYLIQWFEYEFGYCLLLMSARSLNSLKFNKFAKI